MADTADAATIVADYLIITDHQFFEPHSWSLRKIANHRASFNGFDVAIVDVHNIFNLQFSFTNPLYQNEQMIRSFIKRVYEGANANHTYDGQLAFVLLVGDAIENLNIGGVPAAKDPVLTNGVFFTFNDYYYTCITQSIPGNWDVNGDLFIGRFCADNETELYNIVKKTCENESEYSFGSWRKNNSLIYGSGPEAGTTHKYFCEDFHDWIDNLYSPVYSTYLFADLSQTWNQEYINQINGTGSNIVIHYGHASTDTWCMSQYVCWDTALGSLTLQYKKNHLSNSGKYPFCISNGCYTTRYTNGSLADDCMGEELTVYSPEAGYVAYIGCWEKSGLSTTNPGDFPQWFWERIPYAIYKNLSTQLGECILEGRLGLNALGFKTHIEFNLMGDPALNLMAPGYEITRNVNLSGTTTISTKIHVRENATLTLVDGATLLFEEKGQLIIDAGATLVLGGSSTVKGKNLNNVIQVFGNLVGRSDLPNPPNPVPIEYVNLSSLPEQPGQPENTWRGIEFRNPDLSVTFKQCTIKNCKISGVLNNLEIRSTTNFINSSINFDETGLLVDQCIFSNSNILLTNYAQSIRYARIFNSSFQNSGSDAIIKIDHYPAFYIENNTLSYTNGTGIHISYCGNINSQHLIQNCTIQKSGDPQELSWGVVVYHSFADIFNNYISHNKYGIATANLSSVKIMGNASAQSNSQTQQIIDNYQNQVKCFDNSFPYEFHYNVLQNSLAPNPLIYYPSLASCEPKPDPEDAIGLRNIKCNCLPINPILFPENGYIWQPAWCPPANCTQDDPGREDFDLAVANMDSGNYSTAEAQFKAVILEYPENKYARESAKKLLLITILTNNDLAGLKNYYDTTENLHLDSVTSRLTERLMARCDVERKAYQDAIVWYEDAIMNPYSTNDSIYSIIDLEDTYMLAEADSNLKTAFTYFNEQLVQYKPKSRQEYIENKERLIRFLFKESEDKDTTSILPANAPAMFILYQNTPNPFTSETEVSFYVPEKCNIVLFVTNMLGQRILSLPFTGLESGRYSKRINLKGIPNGAYVISLFAHSKEMSRIKSIKNH
ncbi:MAG: C25 family cysteine peptidase [Bacteroidales bacterium]|nr:C25 family cysteine peptidase [Bacteroidales bacterium]